MQDYDVYMNHRCVSNLETKVICGNSFKSYLVISYWSPRINFYAEYFSIEQSDLWFCAQISINYFGNSVKINYFGNSVNVWKWPWHSKVESWKSSVHLSDSFLPFSSWICNYWNFNFPMSHSLCPSVCQFVGPSSVIISL